MLKTKIVCTYFMYDNGGKRPCHLQWETKWKPLFLKNKIHGQHQEHEPYQVIHPE